MESCPDYGQTIVPHLQLSVVRCDAVIKGFMHVGAFYCYLMNQKMHMLQMLCYLFQNQVSDQFPLPSVLSSMCLVATYFDSHMAFSNILDILCFAGVLRIMTEMFLPHISLADVEQTFFSKVLPKV